MLLLPIQAAARYAKDLIAQGKIGRVYHVNMQYFQAWGLPRANCPLVWRYVKSRTGTGALGDLGSHALDLVRFVTNKEYTRVVGHTGTYVHERPLLDGKGVGKVDVDDFSNYMADMEDEISVSFQITRFAYGRGNYQRMEIYGSEGAIVYSLDATPAGIDEIEVCSGDINADAHVFNHLPIPQQYFCDQMQSFADIVNGTGDGLAANIQDGQAKPAPAGCYCRVRRERHMVITLSKIPKAKSDGGWKKIQAPLKISGRVSNRRSAFNFKAERG